jgi:hypothetical protein
VSTVNLYDCVDLGGVQLGRVHLRHLHRLLTLSCGRRGQGGRLQAQFCVVQIHPREEHPPQRRRRED